MVVILYPINKGLKYDRTKDNLVYDANMAWMDSSSYDERTAKILSSITNSLEENI